MFNYLKSEWYRTFRQRRLWVLLGVIFLLGALYYLLAFYAFNWQQPGIESVLGELGTLMPGVGFCLLLFVCEAAFSDEKWLGTFKNSVSFGISRERIYFGKLLNSLRLCLLTLAALVAVLLFGKFIGGTDVGKVCAGIVVPAGVLQFPILLVNGHDASPRFLIRTVPQAEQIRRSVKIDLSLNGVQA